MTKKYSNALMTLLVPTIFVPFDPRKPFWWLQTFNASSCCAMLRKAFEIVLSVHWAILWASYSVALFSFRLWLSCLGVLAPKALVVNLVLPLLLWAEAILHQLLLLLVEFAEMIFPSLRRSRHWTPFPLKSSGASDDVVVQRQSPQAHLFVSPPSVSCKSFAISDFETGDILAEHDMTVPLQPASMTKIVTACVVLGFGEDALDEILTVSAASAAVGGTTAKLLANDRITVRELLYGLLLPSGNDAATALAEHFGPRLPVDKSGEMLLSGRHYIADWEVGSPVHNFVSEMNRFARRVCPKDSLLRFVNPHGLGHGENLICPFDMVQLVRKAMEYPLFCDIVATKKHCCQVRNRRLEWENTNQLLGRSYSSSGVAYEGVKTGWIPNAHGQKIHGCLATVATLRLEDDVPRRVCVVVMGCPKRMLRFRDTHTLMSWVREVLLEKPKCERCTVVW